MSFFKLSQISKKFSNIFIEKNFQVSRLIQSKLMLFEGQLYFSLNKRRTFIKGILGNSSKQCRNLHSGVGLLRLPAFENDFLSLQVASVESEISDQGAHGLYIQPGCTMDKLIQAPEVPSILKLLTGMGCSGPSSLICCCSVAQLCLTFRSPLDFSLPGLPESYHRTVFLRGPHAGFQMVLPNLRGDHACSGGSI